MSHRSVDHEFLDLAIERLLKALDENESARVLYALRYTQSSLWPPSEHNIHTESTLSTSGVPASVDGPILEFPPPSLDPVFDDDTLEQVKEIWKKVMRHSDENESETDNQFMVFEDREGMAAELEGDE